MTRDAVLFLSRASENQFAQEDGGDQLSFVKSAARWFISRQEIFSLDEKIPSQRSRALLISWEKRRFLRAVAQIPHIQARRKKEGARSPAGRI